MMPSAVVLTPEESPAQAPAAPACAAQWDAFLRAHAQQPMSTMRYELGGQTVWVKTASRGNPRWIYGLLRALAMLLRAPVLQPVPNPGGAATIATEVQRLRRLAAAGLRVPEDLSVTGFDGVDLPWWPTPRTTVAQPGSDKGARAARLVRDGLAGEPGHDVVLQAHLVVGATTAPPAA